jgi:L-malate glycosyltransferase
MAGVNPSHKTIIKVKMKITFLIPHIKLGGGTKIILGYADRLYKRGHNITVVCPITNTNKKIIKGISIIYPKRQIMNLSRYKPYWIDVAADIKFVPSFDEKYIPDSDIVVATAWQTAPYVNNYSNSKGKKFYFIQHYETLYHASNNEQKADNTYKYPLKKIVVSSWLKEIMEDKFNSISELITNPIDLEVFYPTRRGYNKDKRICILHHKYKWKGVSDGLEAFKLAKQKFPNIRLVMFGSVYKEVNIDCEYYYRPIKDSLRNIYNSCDIFLCPSWHEGFGLPSAEAMACKCALTTTNNGGCMDYAINDKTALVSPRKDTVKLAQNLIRLLDEENLLKNIANRGYEHIKKFTWDRSLDKMERIFLQEMHNHT